MECCVLEKRMSALLMVERNIIPYVFKLILLKTEIIQIFLIPIDFRLAFMQYSKANLTLQPKNRTTPGGKLTNYRISGE